MNWARFLLALVLALAMVGVVAPAASAQATILSPTAAAPAHTVAGAMVAVSCTPSAPGPVTIEISSPTTGQIIASFSRYHAPAATRTDKVYIDCDAPPGWYDLTVTDASGTAATEPLAVSVAGYTNAGSFFAKGLMVVQGMLDNFVTWTNKGDAEHPVWVLSGLSELGKAMATSLAHTLVNAVVALGDYFSQLAAPSAGSLVP